MPDPTDTYDIVVTAPRILYGLDTAWNIWYRESFLPRGEAQFVGPRSSNDYGIQVYYEGPPEPPSKPTLVAAAIQRMNAAINECAQVILALNDDSVIIISKGESITGKEMKQQFRALKSIKITEKIYQPGYGGANYLSSFEISSTAAAAWNKWGPGATRMLLLHEIAHNTSSGDAVRQQNWNIHLNSGGTRESYIRGNSNFDRQESMTNKIAVNLAGALSINIEPTGYYGPGYPPGGIYSGDDF